MPANPLRGEVDLTIGGVALTIAVTFAGLAELSRMTGADDLATLYHRLVGFEPWTASCALRVFAIHPDGPEKARAEAARAIAKLSSADEGAFRAAFTFALTAHLNEGRKARGEEPLEDQVREAAEGIAGEPPAVA